MHTHPCLASDLLLGGAFDSNVQASVQQGNVHHLHLNHSPMSSQNQNLDILNKLAHLLLFHLTKQTTSLINTTISKCCTTAVEKKHFHPKTKCIGKSNPYNWSVDLTV